MKGNNTFDRFFRVNFQGNLENGSGIMWRYFFGVLKTRKTAKKVTNERKQYMCQIFLNWETVVALCGGSL